MKRAQKECGLSDWDYRDILEMLAGCTSSTDARLNDECLDMVMSFFEAEHWRRCDAETLQPSCKPNTVFQQRFFWRARNNRAENSRDRYIKSQADGQISELQSALAQFGCGEAYFETIRDRVTNGRTDPRAMKTYAAALRKTLDAKRRSQSLAPVA
ncbi:MAG: hypothetical protein L0Z50_07510 [Verrucomicrobiales bacterium]|nr:hypothetical protein [Verrucomicrobiales bacterium]